jgi:hypothetical protein
LFFCLYWSILICQRVAVCQDFGRRWLLVAKDSQTRRNWGYLLYPQGVNFITVWFSMKSKLLGLSLAFWLVENTHLGAFCNAKSPVCFLGGSLDNGTVRLPCNSTPYFVLILWTLDVLFINLRRAI